MPELGDLLRPATAGEWRDWLVANHATATEIWLVYHRKDSGKPFLPYIDALDEALCWGWIDSTVKRLEDGTDSRAQRWTPRRPGSPVSALNKAKVRKLHAAGRMQQVGIDALPGFEEWLDPGPLVIPDDVEAALRDGGAWENFLGFDEAYQRLKVGWIVEAGDREGERERRLRYLVTKSAKGQTYGTIP